MTVMKQPVILT